MEKILVSACLVGDNCKYNGGNNFSKEVMELSKYADLVLICPETFGKLKTPRPPAERIGNKVVNSNHKDVTENYYEGAFLSLAIAKENNIKYALLKENSPSCGSNYIYDGTFSHHLIAGQGVACEILKANGIEVFSENEVGKLFEKITKKER